MKNFEEYLKKGLVKTRKENAARIKSIFTVIW